VDGPPRFLEALVAPIRFAARDGFAGLARLVGFGDTLRAAVAGARSAGAPDSPALRGLAAEAEGFDGLPAEGRQKALGRVAAHLASLVPVPPEIQALARRARVEARPRPSSTARPAAPSSPPPAPRDPGPEHGKRTAHAGAVPAPDATPPPPSEPPLAPEPRTASERAARRARLRTRLADVAGVHPAPRGLLEERGYRTVEEALSFWPKGYQDRTRPSRIAGLRAGEEGLALGTVTHSRTQRMRSGKPILKLGLQDASGRLELVFFNPAPWRLKQFAPGDTLLASGKISEGYGGRLQMSQPEVEKVQPGDSASFGRTVPFYAGPADWQHPALRKLMKRLCDEYAGQAVDDLPPAVRQRRGLVPLGQALRQAHFPPPGTDLALAAERATPAFRRLVFEEFFFLQLALALRRRGVRREPGIAFEVTPERLRQATARLPFALTGAQQRALAEIAADMARPEPMNRLLQGDVGSGKTAVAFAAAMLAAQSGWQAALMAPTEILAEQHARTLGRWLEGSGIELALVGAQARGREQREARRAVASGKARIAVGTHALLEEEVGFARLGLVVVDEQHRFGVLQRARLIGKGPRPDVLVMTATPIPRTLALAFYGDLDQSKIGELPPGRSPVETKVFGDSQRKRAYEIVRRELEAGRQAYVVYPLVAESEKSDLADATGGAEELSRLFAPHAVGLLHGQMRAEEKEAVMDRFRTGAIRLLVATTVIEVGVDVPAATVMLVEHAERFGLSQLHQLRGRVGRGAARSHCLLVAHFRRAGDEARERLQVMVRTRDGFEIARADLRLRGPGEMLGTRQSGQKLFDLADLYRDESILDEAREEAFALAEADPELARPENEPAREALEQRWRGRLSLAQVG
jgi:ATP-dependent DNA helicase RecG